MSDDVPGPPRSFPLLRLRALRGAMLAALLVACAAAPAQNHMNTARFLELATGGDDRARGLLFVAVDGILAGFDAANRELVRRGDAPLFCPPPGAVLQAAWAADRLVDYLEANPGIPGPASIAVVAAAMLAETFPCRRSARRAPR